jgi:hypothetical protein
MLRAMSGIPRSALLLGLAGLLPFAWGALTVLSPGLAEWARAAVSPRLAGQYVLAAYGIVILSFMSGVLWGFATKAEGAMATKGYALSVLPALWTFFMVGGGPQAALSALLVGFLGVFTLDVQFARWGLVPAWWLRLRALLTAGVFLCLLVGLYG